MCFNFLEFFYKWCYIVFIFGLSSFSIVILRFILHVSLVYSFLLQNSIPLYGYAIVGLHDIRYLTLDIWLDIRLHDIRYLVYMTVDI